MRTHEAGTDFSFQVLPWHLGSRGLTHSLARHFGPLASHWVPCHSVAAVTRSVVHSAHFGRHWTLEEAQLTGLEIVQRDPHKPWPLMWWLLCSCRAVTFWSDVMGHGSHPWVSTWDLAPAGVISRASWCPVCMAAAWMLTHVLHMSVPETGAGSLGREGAPCSH